MNNSKKRVCIVGAGLSGLLACKHVSTKGFAPTVFEASNVIGGVWARTFSITCLQTPRTTYTFSDFAWDPAVKTMNPTHDQVLAYLDSYAKHFDLEKYVRFGCRVVSIEYVGVDEDEVRTWDQWSGTGDAFGDGRGIWRVNVQGPDGNIQVHEADFVILCIGRFSGLPNIPIFPPKAGPEVFKGKMVHSVEYSDMGYEKAHELIKGKRVTVVGCMKSGLDIATQCAIANGIEKPCTMLCRSKQWLIPDFSAWGVPIHYIYYTRFSELFFHKPGEGFLLWLLATVLSPLGWLFTIIFIETYYKMVSPMKKYGMVPNHRFSTAYSSCLLVKLPDKFYDRVGEGSIIIKDSKKFSFCNSGVIVEGETEPIESDVVILATGYKGDKKMINIFVSPYFQKIISNTPSSTIPLYRDCVFPRIPQLAVVGFQGSLANLFTFELRSIWIANFIDGGFRVPSIRKMEENVNERVKYGCASTNIWYNDLICKDIGYNPRRKKGILADWFLPYMPEDYSGI